MKRKMMTIFLGVLVAGILVGQDRASAGDSVVTQVAECSDCDSRFVNAGGDKMKGNLKLIKGANLYVDGNVGVGTDSPKSKLEVNGIIYSTAGGIKFPDETVQTSAAVIGIANVKECGAKVDGVTDDTVALNTCLAEHATVLVPSGTLLHSGTIVMNAGNHLVGVGSAWIRTGGPLPTLPTTGGTTLLYTGSDVAVEALNSDAVVADWHGSIRGVLIRSGGGTTGIHLKNLADFTIQDTIVNGQESDAGPITGFTTAGIHLDGFLTSSSALITVRITRTWVQQCAGYGIFAGGVNNVNAIAITNSRIQGNQNIGVYSGGRSRGWLISGSDIEGNVGGQIRIDNGEAWVIQGNYFEAVDVSTMVWLRQCKGCTVTGNNFTGSGIGNTAAGILVGDTAGGGYLGQGITIEGNEFQGMTAAVSLDGVNDITIRNNFIWPEQVGVQVGGLYSNVLHISRLDSNEMTPAVYGNDTTFSHVTNTTTETAIYTVNPIPGNTILTQGGIYVQLSGLVTNNTGSDQALTIRLNYGGVTLTSIRWAAISTNINPRALVLRFFFGGTVSQWTSAQACWAEGLLGDGNSLGGNPDSVPTTRLQTCNSAVGADSTTDQVLTVTAQFDVANPNLTMTREIAHLLRYPF